MAVCAETERVYSPLVEALRNWIEVPKRLDYFDDFSGRLGREIGRCGSLTG